MFKKFLSRLSRNELISYVVGTVIGLAGLAVLILGIVADNLPIDNDFAKSQPAFPLRYLGLIIFAVGVLVYIATLSIYAKKTDRVLDKEKRRQQRLQAMLNEAPADDAVVVNKSNPSAIKPSADFKVPNSNKTVDAIKKINEKPADKK